MKKLSKKQINDFLDRLIVTANTARNNEKLAMDLMYVITKLPIIVNKSENQPIHQSKCPHNRF